MSCAAKRCASWAKCTTKSGGYANGHDPTTACSFLMLTRPFNEWRRLTIPFLGLTRRAKTPMAVIRINNNRPAWRVDSTCRQHRRQRANQKNSFQLQLRLFVTPAFCPKTDQEKLLNVTTGVLARPAVARGISLTGNKKTESSLSLNSISYQTVTVDEMLH